MASNRETGFYFHSLRERCGRPIDAWSSLPSTIWGMIFLNPVPWAKNFLQRRIIRHELGSPQSNEFLPYIYILTFHVSRLLSSCITRCNCLSIVPCHVRNNSNNRVRYSNPQLASLTIETYLTTYPLAQSAILFNIKDAKSSSDIPMATSSLKDYPPERERISRKASPRAPQQQRNIYPSGWRGKRKRVHDIDSWVYLYTGI